MKARISILVVLFINISSFAQHSIESTNRGTIKVQKKGHLVKVRFDDVNYRLIGIDQYGNVLDTAVIEFQMSVTIQGIFYTEKTVGPALTYQMQQLLGRCDNNAKILFKNIKAKDRSGAIIEIPPFQYVLAYSDN